MSERERHDGADGYRGARRAQSTSDASGTGPASHAVEVTPTLTWRGGVNVLTDRLVDPPGVAAVAYHRDDDEFS